MKKLEEQSKKIAQFLKAMSHPQRFLVLCALYEKELTVSELLGHTTLSQSHLSQALGKMKLDNLVKIRKDGRTHYYSLKDKRVKDLLKTLHQLF